MYLKKKDFISVAPFTKSDLNMILGFLMEIKVPLVMQRLLNSFFVVLIKILGAHVCQWY